MTSLDAFRDHCSVMAKAQHKLDCPSLSEPKWVEAPPDHKGRTWMGLVRTVPPKCDGCLTDADRALFAQMAGEIDDYREQQVDLFGELSTEPSLEDA